MVYQTAQEAVKIKQDSLNHIKKDNFLSLSILIHDHATETHGQIMDRSTTLRGRYGNPLQNSCLESPMDGGAWWATVHGVTKSQTWLKEFSTHATAF